MSRVTDLVAEAAAADLQDIVPYDPLAYIRPQDSSDDEEETLWPRKSPPRLLVASLGRHFHERHSSEVPCFALNWNNEPQPHPHPFHPSRHVSSNLFGTSVDELLFLASDPCPPTPPPLRVARSTSRTLSEIDADIAHAAVAAAQAMSVSSVELGDESALPPVVPSPVASGDQTLSSAGSHNVTPLTVDGSDPTSDTSPPRASQYSGSSSTRAASSSQTSERSHHSSVQPLEKKWLPKARRDKGGKPLKRRNKRVGTSYLVPVEDVPASESDADDDYRDENESTRSPKRKRFAKRAISFANNDAGEYSDGATCDTRSRRKRAAITTKAAATGKKNAKERHPCIIPGCEESFTRPNDVQRHMRNAAKHKTAAALDDDSATRCKLCGEELSRADARKRHELKASCGKRTIRRKYPRTPMTSGPANLSVPVVPEN